LIAGYVKNKKTQLAGQMRTYGESPELLNQARELDKLLNGIKERG
jgi:hypothetical protein